MAFDAVVRGMTIGWVGIHGPLVLLHADEQGGRLTPRWRWLPLVSYSWEWDEVKRVDVLRGPLGGTRGVRIALASRSQDPVLVWGGRVSGFVLGLGQEPTEQLLTLVPASVPREARRALFAW
jgi:hypothetical protein